MTQSASIKYNRNLHKIFAPDIERLKKVEGIADEILCKIESLVTPFNYSERCHLINAIQRIISEKTDLKNSNLITTQ